jgi:hypothetical protein
MLLFLSHSAGRRDDPDWWIVEPRDDPEQQVISLLRADRRVLAINTTLGSGGILELTTDNLWTSFDRPFPKPRMIRRADIVREGTGWPDPSSAEADREASCSE